MSKCRTVDAFAEKLNNATYKINLVLGLDKNSSEKSEELKKLINLLEKEETIEKINRNVSRLSFVNNGFTALEVESILKSLNGKIPSVSLAIAAGNTMPKTDDLKKYPDLKILDFKTLSPEDAEKNKEANKDFFLKAAHGSISKRAKSASSPTKSSRPVIGEHTQSVALEGCHFRERSGSFSGMATPRKQ